MKLVACYTCSTVLSIIGTDEEVTYLLRGATNYPCTEALCQGRMFPIALSAIPSHIDIKDMPLRNFFRAMNGFGSGEGAPATLDRLRELFMTHPVVEMKAFSGGKPERVILQEMVFANGSRIHFGISSLGACVHYIEERGKSCLETVENDLASTGTKDTPPVGEEVRRAYKAVVEEQKLGYRGYRDDQFRATELPKPGSMPAVSETSSVPASGVQGLPSPSSD